MAMTEHQFWAGIEQLKNEKAFGDIEAYDFYTSLDGQFLQKRTARDVDTGVQTWIDITPIEQDVIDAAIRFDTKETTRQSKEDSDKSALDVFAALPFDSANSVHLNLLAVAVKALISKHE